MHQPFHTNRGFRTEKEMLKACEKHKVRVFKRGRMWILRGISLDMAVADWRTVRVIDIEANLSNKPDRVLLSAW